MPGGGKSGGGKSGAGGGKSEKSTGSVGRKSGAGGSHVGKSKTAEDVDDDKYHMTFDMSSVDLSAFLPGEVKVAFMHAAMLSRMQSYRGFTVAPTGPAVLDTTVPAAIDHIKPTERKYVFETKGVCALHGALHKSADCVELIKMAASSSAPYSTPLLTSILPPRRKAASASASAGGAGAGSAK